MSSTQKNEAALELAELQRKYRIMEGDRKSYTEESSNLIRKQRATIDKLKAEVKRKNNVFFFFFFFLFFFISILTKIN
jgi:hypothetical protein